MRQIDEKELLAAVGYVGDDLILRAEHSGAVRRRKSHFRTLAAAACLCLAAALTWPAVRQTMPVSGNDATQMQGSSQNMAPVRPEAADENDMSADGAAGASAALSACGISSAEDISGVILFAPVSRDGVSETEKVHGASEEALQATGDAAAQLYSILAAADAVPAENAPAAFSPLQTITVTLASGTVLEGQYDPEHAILFLGAYYFCGADLSALT